MDELVDLMSYFMCEFHVFRVAYQQPMYLGGMDEGGNCLVNEYSYLWLDAYNKLSADVSKIGTRMEGFADEFSAILSRQIDERLPLAA